MKKILVLMFVAIISLNMATAADGIKSPNNNQQNFTEVRAQRMAAFEKRLGLTEEQKIKAKQIRINGHEKMKPVIDEIRSKKQEAKMVKMSRIAVQVQEERLAEIDAQLKVLEKQAQKIRKSNMKDFESILTRNQKKILKQMKKEGRKNFQVTHPAQKPFSSIK